MSNTDDRALADLIAELRDGVSSQSHDMCGYEKKDDTIIRLRRQRRELAKVATTAIDRLEAFHAASSEESTTGLACQPLPTAKPQGFRDA